MSSFQGTHINRIAGRLQSRYNARKLPAPLTFAISMITINYNSCLITDTADPYRSNFFIPTRASQPCSFLAGKPEKAYPVLFLVMRGPRFDFSLSYCGGIAGSSVVAGLPNVCEIVRLEKC